MIKLMTPGPTQVRENVRLARAEATTNPDLDLEFYDFYKETCDMLGDFFHTKNPFYILSGEGILGLEAACASLTERGSRVLCIENGVFGQGFADFIRIYGGVPIAFSGDWKTPLCITKLKEFLEIDHDFAYATVVHCDTPSGILNDVEGICALLKSYGILSVVDSVAAAFAVPLDMDKGCIDILCGGSQKALSAPIGLTFLGVSLAAISYMERRATPIAAFYANILLFKNYYKDKWFPYTMPISDIYGFRVALDNVITEGDAIFKRHQSIAVAIRDAFTAVDLPLYLRGGFSPTITAVLLPPNIKDTDILYALERNYNIAIARSIGNLSGKVIRIGHMGENANIHDVWELLSALTAVFALLGRPLAYDMGEVFLKMIEEKE